MRKYILKRIIISFFTMIVITLVLFLLLQFMPGSPFNDEKLSEEQKALLYAKYGLDKPVVIQFLRYIGSLFRGDFGVSYNISKNTPILSLISQRLPISIKVGFYSVFIGTLAGLALGIVAAIKHNTIWDTAATVISLLRVSIPSYVFALALS